MQQHSRQAKEQSVPKGRFNAHSLKARERKELYFHGS